MNSRDRIPKALFDKNGHYYGRPADFNDKIIERRLNLVKEIPDFLGNKFSLLDIGCGNGASMFGLHNYMKFCLGVDICTKHISSFESFIKCNQIYNCYYKLLDIEKSVPLEQFDRIISFEVIEHLENENNVDFYYHSLKTDGLMAITVPNKWWVFETHGVKNSSFPWNRVPFLSWLPRPVHEKFANARIYTKRRISKLLESHGFKIVSMTYIMAPMDVLPKGRFKDFVVKLIFNKDTTNVPFKATSIFVVAKKR